MFNLLLIPNFTLTVTVRIMEEEEKEGNHSDHDHDHDEVEGLHIESCPDHWPTYNFMASQTWCCDAWCYVVASLALHAKYVSRGHA